jgi:small neutral amino acid transporter SnatA (MarC family)
VQAANLYRRHEGYGGRLVLRMHEGKKPKQRKDMNINLDRPRRVRATLTFWLFFLAVAGLLAFLLMKFTGSKMVAFGLAGGMLLYMLIAAALTSKSLSQDSSDGRFD